ncbi:partner and localizer of BRCA2 isoform X2 [Rhineura floridana]|uniref:partner and localizer of BRCA2 isoform X2 n=1 Tax=Rhineura floridana TaxID=261503 RepID=UPI002AC7E9FC|nr:partner and localizer of BRCA2 isoform X2 [Rhineura floridana]
MVALPVSWLRRPQAHARSCPVASLWTPFRSPSQCAGAAEGAGNAVGMESPRGQFPTLTAQEKAQLKEKLALLKREYSKTFHRLQRAERAEKVKNYVKKTVAKQNLYLMQEEAEKDLAECISQTSPDGSCSEKCSAKSTSVAFKPEPFSLGCLPENSTSLCSNQGRKRVLFSPVGSVPERSQDLVSRSRTKERQRASLALGEGGGSLCEATRRNAACQPGCETASVKGSRSPVFTRSSILEPDPDIPKASSVVTVKGRGTDVPPVLLPLGSFQETPGKPNFPGESHPSLLALSYENQEPTPEHLCEEGISANAQNESPQMAQARMDEEEPGRLADLAVTRGTSQGDPTAPHACGDEMHKQGSQCQASQSSVLGHGDSPTSKPSEKGLGDRLEETGSPLLEGSAATPAKDVLGSCTVVEGLLFPVEYYIRTTRRISSHQREVNLVAVIQSQLGKSRKGQRIKSKERNTDPALSSFHGPAESDERLRAVPSSLPGADASPGKEAPPPQSLCNESTASGRGLAHRTGLSQHRRRGRPRRRSHRRALSCLSQDPAEDLELAIPKGDGCLALREAQEMKESFRRKAGVLSETASGSMEAKQNGWKWPTVSSLSAAVPHKAEVANVGAGAGASFVGSLEGNSETCLPESQPPGPSGASLVQAGEVSLPHCETLAAFLKGKGLRASQGRRGAGPPVRSWDPVSLCLSGTDAGKFPLPFHAKDNKASSLKWLPCSLDLQEFHLPEDEFGLLKLEKLKASAVNPLESFDSGKSAECLPYAGESTLDKGSALEENLIPLEQEAPIRAPFPGLPELLSSPALEGVSSLPESQLPAPVFPLVGATPASQALPLTFCESAVQTQACPASAPGDFTGASALSRSGQEEKERRGRRTPSLSPGQKGVSWDPGEAVGSFGEERQLPAGESVEPFRESPTQSGIPVEDPAEDSQRKGSLRMTSELKSCSGSSSVDVGTVWWEAAGFTELCIVTASEASVSLWRHLEPGHWGAVYTWHFTKVPVIQIVPLPGVKSLVCVALGGLEIAEIRFLFQSSEDGCVEESLMKAGNINTVLGLKNSRLVVSGCGSLQEQEVEVFSFSEAGRSNGRQALMPPEETVLAFAEVDGMPEALVGITTLNSLVIWNLRTGQLLRKVPLGCCYPQSVCHKAYSDSVLGR